MAEPEGSGGEPAGSDALQLQTVFDPAHGTAVPVAPGVLRVTAPNAGPFTFHGTNSYLIGERSVVVIDPGPDDERHLQTLLAAIGGRPVEAILLTHTHRDHTALLPRFKAATGHPPVLGEGPHRAARPLHEGETNRMDAAGDHGVSFDRFVADGDRLDFEAATLGVVATPGHTVNHVAFTLGDTGTVLTGDHVMAWSTTVVAPPDGSMPLFMASLDRLIERDDQLYLPGHGGTVTRPRAFLRGLKTHRKMRESAILARLAAGDQSIPDIVAAIYRSTDPRLHGAAALSILAHLEDLVERGLASTAGPPLLDGRYRPA